jgi:hypothetical protein
LQLVLVFKLEKLATVIKVGEQNNEFLKIFCIFSDIFRTLILTK